MRRVFDIPAVNDLLGNAEPLRVIYPKYDGPVVRVNSKGLRELSAMHWGFIMPQKSKKTGDPIQPKAINNARDDKVRTSRFRKTSFEFLADCCVAIDNNPAKCALRPIGIGKNWLFAGADTGAETLDRAMTITETAKLNGLDPQAYLADILHRIHDHKINRTDELLPWNWTLMALPNSQAA